MQMYGRIMLAKEIDLRAVTSVAVAISTNHHFILRLGDQSAYTRTVTTIGTNQTFSETFPVNKLLNTVMYPGNQKFIGFEAYGAGNGVQWYLDGALTVNYSDGTTETFSFSDASLWTQYDAQSGLFIQKINPWQITTALWEKIKKRNRYGQISRCFLSSR